ncbi:hypothetical protein [Streptomyces sp. NPDC003832]
MAYATPASAEGRLPGAGTAPFVRDRRAAPAGRARTVGRAPSPAPGTTAPGAYVVRCAPGTALAPLGAARRDPFEHVR